MCRLSVYAVLSIIQLLLHSLITSQICVRTRLCCALRAAQEPHHAPTSPLAGRQERWDIPVSAPASNTDKALSAVSMKWMHCSLLRWIGSFFLIQVIGSFM